MAISQHVIATAVAATDVLIVDTCNKPIPMALPLVVIPPFSVRAQRPAVRTVTTRPNGRK
jgi:hypothetical protein